MNNQSVGRRRGGGSSFASRHNDRPHPQFPPSHYQQQRQTAGLPSPTTTSLPVDPLKQLDYYSALLGAKLSGASTGGTKREEVKGTASSHEEEPEKGGGEQKGTSDVVVVGMKPTDISQESGGSAVDDGGDVLEKCVVGSEDNNSRVDIVVVINEEKDDEKEENGKDSKNIDDKAMMSVGQQQSTTTDEVVTSTTSCPPPPVVLLSSTTPSIPPPPPPPRAPSAYIPDNLILWDSGKSSDPNDNEAASRDLWNRGPSEFHPEEIARLVGAAPELSAADTLVSRHFRHIKKSPKCLVRCLYHISLFAPALGPPTGGGMAQQKGERGGGRGGEEEWRDSNNSYAWAGSVLVQRLRSEIMSQLKAQAGSFDGSDLALLLQGLARGRVREMPVYRAVAVAAGRGHLNFSVQELQAMLRSLLAGLELNADSNGGIEITSSDGAFVDMVIGKLKKLSGNLKNLQARQLCSIIRSLARLGHKDVELLQLTGVEVLRRQQEFSDGDWSTCVRAFTQFGVPLRDDCTARKRPKTGRDWEKPPPPKMPQPMSLS
eukprot:GHVS01039962.1.p1 GENE.GHVS01039962.1~~GHVS01039962.1.p1  ORF type:complete len:544 (-),score=144.32 GHVS01039962.1:335-1966(-)